VLLTGCYRFLERPSASDERVLFLAGYRCESFSRDFVSRIESCKCEGFSALKSCLPQEAELMGEEASHYEIPIPIGRKRLEG
jgi:hypothetical protein